MSGAFNSERCVLVVDDEQTFLETLDAILTKEGFQVLIADSAEAALKILEENIPDAVLTDIQMPGMDGYALCRKIKSSKTTADLPVIMVSGFIDKSHVDEGFSAGAVDYIRKPFDRDDVVMRVRNQIMVSETVAERFHWETRYQALFDGVSEGIVAIDTKTQQVTLANSAACTLFGYTRDELVGLRLKDFIPAERREKTVVGFQAVSRGELTTLNDMPILRKGGTVVYLDMKVMPIVIAGRPCNVGFMTDVSERRIIERELESERRRLAQMEVEYRNAQKLEAVGQLAAGIAHEINTPAQFVGDNTRFLQDAFSDLQEVISLYDEALTACVGHDSLEKLRNQLTDLDFEYLTTEIPRAIEQSLDGIGRIATIVSAMKEFAHPGTGTKTLVNINESLATTLTVSRNEWKYVAEVATDFDARLPLVPCLASEMNQVFLNLIVNAAHAIEERITAGGLEGKGLITVSTVGTGSEVKISIVDNGQGIPADIQDRIMEPFFTTKDIGKGTGQGLALAHATVAERHGGTLRFESEVGKGTAFFVSLPVDDSEA